jgi:arylsulfatase A-like enzyme
VTFVDLLRAAGYDTALIGKSHLQTVTSWPVKLDPPVERDGFEKPPADLAEAVRSDLDDARYKYEQDSFYQTESPDVPKPFYATGSIRVEIMSCI